MSHYDRKYNDVGYDQITHSTPKKSRDDYGSAVSSSYIPGQMSGSTQNYVSDLHQGENVSVKSGISRTVTQKTSVSSTKSSGYSSEEGRREDDIGSTDVLNSRISGALGSSMDVDADNKYHGVDKPKPTDLGFQYEDIQSFRDRQKLEGDRLKVERKSLTGNIIGTGKHGAMRSEYTTENTPNDRDVSSYTSRVSSSSHYTSSSDSDPLSRANLLAEARATGADVHSSRERKPGEISSYSSRITSTDSDPLSREKLLEEARTRNKDLPSGAHTSSSSSYSVSSSTHSDPLSREKLLADARRQEYRYSSRLSSSKEDLTGASKDNDASSRYGSTGSALQSSRYSSGLSKSREDITSSTKDSDPLSRYGGGSRESSLYSSRYSSGLSRSIEDILGSSKDRSDALVAKYLHSSRNKGLSKHASESDLALRSRHSPLTGIKEESSKDTEIKHHSVGGKPMSYLSSSTSYEDLLQRKRESVSDSKPNVSGLSSSTSGTSYSSRHSYGGGSSREPDRTPGGTSDVARKLRTELQDERKARQDAIDRLLGKTKRYSSDSILDKKSDVGAMKAEDRTRGSQGIDAIDRNRLSRDLGLDDNARRPGSTDTDTSKHGVTAQEERIHRHSESSSYETPYTSLDHSYKPTRYKPLTGNSFDDGRIYDQPLKSGESPDMHRPDSSRGRPNGIYDKLRRGSDQTDNDFDKRRGSREGLLGDSEPLYDHLNTSDLKPSRGRGSPIPISDKFSLPLDKYDKPVAVHGRSKDPSRTDDPRGREIVSRHTDPRDYGLSDYSSEQRGNVTETTRTSYMERSFMSRNGEVIKDETKHHEELRHGGQNAIEGTDQRGSNADLPTRVKRYPPAKADDRPYDRRINALDSTKTTEEVRRTHGVSDTDRKRDESAKLDDILRRSGININDTGDTTNYQEQSRKDEVTRFSDDSNVRAKVHRTDVNTNVNIVREIVTEKKERSKEKSAKSGIAGLRSKIEALTKSVDDLMNYKHKTLLRSYVDDHGNRRPSRELESLPKPDYYEVKSKRYEPDIKLDEVDYVHKEVEIDQSPQKPDIQHREVNVENMWTIEDQQGLDIGLRIPKQTSIESNNKEMEWWNAPTAEEADRFLCIGDWQWWNANTTENVDNILGIRAINKETGAAGAIIAKYQGDEKPIEWAWLQASQQPSSAQKRRTLTNVLKKDKKVTDEWWDAPTAEDADKHLSIGNYKWWEENKNEGVDKVLGVRGSNEETGTILATYKGGTKPTAWTWVQTSEQNSDSQEVRKHNLRRSSQDLYIDEPNPGNVELLIRVKDEETTEQQQPRYLAIRPGPVEKAIIIREIIKEEVPNEMTSDMTSDVPLYEGKSGEGLQIKDGFVSMRIKDMTPDARKAWLDIMGIEKKNFKLKEHDTLEIPVKFVDQQHLAEDIYAVPQKKKKKKGKQILERIDEKDGTPTIPTYKGTITENKKKEVKRRESDKERKKQEQKSKKIEEEKRKAEKEILKKKAKEESQKKKAEESIKKKKEKKESESQRKKKEMEKVKERKSEKKKKEQLVKKSSASSTTVDGPTIDRSLKPQTSSKRVVQESHVQEITSNRRRSSGDFSSGSNISRDGKKRLSQVEVTAVHHEGSAITGTKGVTKVGPGHSSVKKLGPFGMSNKVERPQSTRGRITTQSHSKSSHTVFGDKLSPPKRESPSVKVVKRVDITQNSSDRTDSVKNKSGSLQRKTAGSQIAVPFRGGIKHGDGNVSIVVPHQRSQSQKVPSQRIKQTRIEKTKKTYRTETKVFDPTNVGIAYPVQQPLPLERSISDSQAQGHMIQGPSGDPFNTVPIVRHDKESHVVETKALNRRSSGDPFNTVPLERRGSGHSVQNLSVTSRTSVGSPNVVQMVRRSSGDLLNKVPIDRRESGHSVTNVSVTSRTSEGSPNVVQMVRRSSGDQVNGQPMERRGSSHSVRNVSVTTHTTEGQPNVQVVRQSSGGHVSKDPMERRGSSHSVRNMSVTSRTTVKTSDDHVNTVPVVVDGAPLSRQSSQGHTVEHHSNSSQSSRAIERRGSGDPWKRDLSEIPLPNVVGSNSNVSYYKEEKELPHGYMQKEVVRKTQWSVE